MSIQLKPGARLYSAVCSTEMIAVKAPAHAIDLTIGGVTPVTSGDQRTPGTPVAGHDAGTAMGKRYVDEADTVELLCTKPGPGVPALDGAPLQIKSAKALPASD